MSRRLMLITAGTALSMVIAGVSLTAHHAFAAEFDANKPLRMKGTVTKMEWLNPHVWLHMDVKTKEGKLENWAFEAGTPVCRTPSRMRVMRSRSCAGKSASSFRSWTLLRS